MSASSFVLKKLQLQLEHVCRLQVKKKGGCGDSFIWLRSFNGCCSSQERKASSPVRKHWQKFSLQQGQNWEYFLASISSGYLSVKAM
ncbi:hypothetical protein OPV22_007287 [Ensete ventricosum]|uniref:Uncharacterized protein n=1 Tax=Ensete ventricosum TaxID=4639 RepID=A0AAV8RTC4_ENSVE|nr:hypothetical protein OPV22_007287 [Ensete ventricosum]